MGAVNSKCWDHPEKDKNCFKGIGRLKLESTLQAELEEGEHYEGSVNAFLNDIHSKQIKHAVIDFIVMEDGSVRWFNLKGAWKIKQGETGTPGHTSMIHDEQRANMHMDQEAPVIYAGEIIYNKKGKMYLFTNKSGHFHPLAEHFEQICKVFNIPKDKTKVYYGAHSDQQNYIDRLREYALNQKDEDENVDDQYIFPMNRMMDNDGVHDYDYSSHQYYSPYISGPDPDPNIDTALMWSSAILLGIFAFCLMVFIAFICGVVFGRFTAYFGSSRYAVIKRGDEEFED